MMDDAKIAVFAAGITSRAAKEAVLMARKKGIRVGMLRPLTIWPFPDEAIKKYLGDKKAIIVPELNEGQLSKAMKRVMGAIWSYELRKSKNIIGINKNNGELINPEEILKVIKEVK